MGILVQKIEDNMRIGIIGSMQFTDKMLESHKSCL